MRNVLIFLFCLALLLQVTPLVLAADELLVQNTTPDSSGRFTGIKNWWKNNRNSAACSTYIEDYKKAHPNDYEIVVIDKSGTTRIERSPHAKGPSKDRLVYVSRDMDMRGFLNCVDGSAVNTDRAQEDRKLSRVIYCGSHGDKNGLGPKAFVDELSYRDANDKVVEAVGAPAWQKTVTQWERDVTKTGQSTQNLFTGDARIDLEVCQVADGKFPQFMANTMSPGGTVRASTEDVIVGGYGLARRSEFIMPDGSEVIFKPSEKTNSQIVSEREIAYLACRYDDINSQFQQAQRGEVSDIKEYQKDMALKIINMHDISGNFEQAQAIEPLRAALWDARSEAMGGGLDEKYMSGLSGQIRQVTRTMSNPKDYVDIKVAEGSVRLKGPLDIKDLQLPGESSRKVSLKQSALGGSSAEKSGQAGLVEPTEDQRTHISEVLSSRDGLQAKEQNLQALQERILNRTATSIHIEELKEEAKGLAGSDVIKRVEQKMTEWSKDGKEKPMEDFMDNVLSAEESKAFKRLLQLDNHISDEYSEWRKDAGERLIKTQNDLKSIDEELKGAGNMFGKDFMASLALQEKPEPAPEPSQEIPVAPEPQPVEPGQAIPEAVQAPEAAKPVATPIPSDTIEPEISPAEPPPPTEPPSVEAPPDLPETDRSAAYDRIRERRRARQQKLQGQTPPAPEVVAPPQPVPPPPQPVETGQWSTGELMQEGMDRYMDNLRDKIQASRANRGQQQVNSQAYQAQLAEQRRLQMQQAQAVMQQATGIFRTFNAANDAYNAQQHQVPVVSPSPAKAAPTKRKLTESEIAALTLEAINSGMRGANQN